jgi:hypothetical protein
MANFSDILNKRMDEIEPPVPLPVGTYLCLVDGQPEPKELGKNNTPAVIFNLKFCQALPDVDQRALQDALKGKNLSDRSIQHTLWLDDNPWKLKQFLKDHLRLTDATTPLEAMSQAPGRQVMVNLGHRASEDGNAIYMNIKSTAAVPS